MHYQHPYATMRTSRSLPAWVAFSILFSVMAGCTQNGKMVDATLKLSKESRLPSWYSAPEKVSRDQIDCRIVFFADGDVQFQIKAHTAPMERRDGKSKPHPIMGDRGYITFPNYTIITVNGISDVYEQKTPTNVLYISDDPKLISSIKQPKRSIP